MKDAEDDGGLSDKIGGRKRKAQRHDQKFIMAFMSSECCFWDIFFLHSDLMIP
jgi:hypothetical protein